MSLDISLQKRSADCVISMNSPASSPVPRPSEFHTYNAFLRGWTTDVTARICASWDAIYNCHRVVLVQAVCTPFRSFQCTLRLHRFKEFFRNLFTGGFVESE